MKFFTWQLFILKDYKFLPTLVHFNVNFLLLYTAIICCSCFRSIDLPPVNSSRPILANGIAICSKHKVGRFNYPNGSKALRYSTLKGVVVTRFEISLRIVNLPLIPRANNLPLFFVEGILELNISVPGIGCCTEKSSKFFLRFRNFLICFSFLFVLHNLFLINYSFKRRINSCLSNCELTIFFYIIS